MAIKLTADEAFAVYFAMDDALRNRRNGTGSKHEYPLTEEEHKKLQGRYLRAALVLERIEVDGRTDALALYSNQRHRRTDRRQR